MSKIGARDWLANTHYDVDDLVYVGDKYLYRCIIAHDSGASFDISNWESVGVTPYFSIKNLSDTSINSNTASRTAFASWDNATITESGEGIIKFVNSGQIQVTKAGIYEIDCSLYQESIIARSNVGIALGINNTIPLVIGASGYIRSSSGHNESSAHLSYIVKLDAGDNIYILKRGLANVGIVSAPAGLSVLNIKKIA